MTNFGSRAFSLLLLGCCLMGTSCHSDQPVESLANRFRIGYQEVFKGDANPLLVLSSLPARLDSIGEFQNLLVSVDTHYLSRAGKDKHLELETRLREEWAQWEPYRTDPARYNLGGLLKRSLVSSVGHSGRERVGELTAIMEQADAYYTAARKNLVVADVNLYRLASQKQYLGLEFLKKELRDSLAGFSLSSAEKAALESTIRQTELALKDYMGFCESVYLNYRDSTYYTTPDRQKQNTATLQ